MSRHHGERRSVLKRSWVGATLVALIGAGGMTALNVTSTTAASAATVNLVADPTLSKGAATWYTRSGGSLAVVAGHNGHLAIRMRNETAAPLTLALNDRVNTVHATVAGATDGVPAPGVPRGEPRERLAAHHRLGARQRQLHRQGEPEHGRLQPAGLGPAARQEPAGQRAQPDPAVDARPARAGREAVVTETKADQPRSDHLGPGPHQLRPDHL